MPQPEKRALACYLCDELKILKKSHSIPNSVFRQIFSRNNGQALLISDQEGVVGNSQASGADYLLCSECEAKFAKRYDQYAFTRLKRLQTVFLSSEPRKKVELNHARMAGFILSVFWRCSISSSAMYEKFNFPPQYEELQKAVLRAETSPFELGAFSIHRLTDRAKHIPNDFMSQFVAGPFLHEGRDKKRRPVLAAFVVFQGFFFSFVMPKRSTKVGQHPAYLCARGEQFSTIDLPMQNFPPLWDFLVAAGVNQLRKDTGDSG